MKKHAYLIMAHGSYEQLGFLISLLDHDKNDIFLHIDKKSSFSELDQQKLQGQVEKSQLIFVPRVAVYWGGYSQVEAEMSLFKTAYQYGDYCFYHLLSGIDLPLHSQETIHSFFEQHLDKIFLTMMTLEGDKENIDRLKYYHLFGRLTPRTFPGVFGKAFFKVYRHTEVFLQKILGINRLKRDNLTPIKAANWGSFPQDIIKLVVSLEKQIEQTFKYSFLADEVFIPYLLQEHNLLGRLYDSRLSYDRKEDFQGNLRYINWWDGNPYTWTSSGEDKSALLDAREKGYLFSRKFNIESDDNMKDFILKLVE